VNAAIAIAEKSDSTVAAFRRSTITGIRPATAKLLDGFALQFDSLSNGVVNVRVTIPNPELLTADSLLSGSVADADIAATRNHFSRHFRQ
jgi:hypothetical protein